MAIVFSHNAFSVAIDESGQSAQVLIFPYYNVNNGFSTSFNIRNIKNEYKAVKFRFRESEYSNDVLDFNIYMSPYDHYSFTLSRDNQGRAHLYTVDTTCALPVIPAEGVALNGTFFENTTDKDAREGYLEVIEMGVLEDGKPINSERTIYEGLKHIEIGPNKFAPRDCSVINKAWGSKFYTQGGALADPAYIALADTVNFPLSGKIRNGYYSDEPAENPSPGLPDHILPPTGGLRGFEVLLDLSKGAANMVEAVAIRNYQKDYAQHYQSSEPWYQLLPSLASGNDYTSVVPRDDGLGSITNTWSPVRADWAIADPYVAQNSGVPAGNNPFPLADVLAAKALTNEFLIDPGFLSATDWVLTFPMRKHGIYNGYRYGGFTPEVPATASSPALQRVQGFSANDNVNIIDINYTLESWNREESQEVTLKSKIDREVTVLTFKNNDNPTSVVLGTDFAKQLTLRNGLIDGWAKLSFETKGSLADLGNTNGWLKNRATANTVGVPVIGFAIIRGGDNTVTRDAIGELVPHTMIRQRGN